MASRNETLIQRDLKHVWHPCTQMRDHEWLPMIPIRSGKGVWLEDYNGNRYLDAVSSWWVNLFGHTNPRIVNALREQIETLEHTLLGGFTHEPAIQLAERLCEVSPPGLNRCFYADNGSSAVEIALKMSFHYWRNHGKTAKTEFVTLSNSYHGETLGALAVGDVSLYREIYAPLLMRARVAPSPDCYGVANRADWAEHSRQQFTAMHDLLAQHHQTIAAVIVEPLIQCAGGMRMYDPLYLTLLRDACDQYNVHLIADEIAVGFGRTGTLFACEQANITPDFMCLSKGLTGGFMPLAAVLTADVIYNAFYDDHTTQRAFLHSHSYTGNPLGCRAALASLDIFRDDDIINRNRELAKLLQNATAAFADHPHVAEVRQTGMIVAIEMVKNKTTREPYPWQERRGLRVYQHALSRGVILRPLGNVIYFMPPYIITAGEIALMAQVASEGIDLATKD